MTKVELDTFSGPLTAIRLNEWLRRCEKAFQLWDGDNAPSKLSDQRKVDSAGERISPTGVTHELSEWWSDTDDITTWAAFKEAVKEQALGSDWRTRALEAFYTTRQDGRSAKEYVQLLDENRSVIANAVPGSQIKPVDDFTFKCYMLFNATPAITAKLMDDGFDIAAASVNQVKEKIRKTSEVVTGASPARSLANASGYLLLDPWGNTSISFDDLSTLPRMAKDLGQMTKVTLWSNNNTYKYMVQRYQFQFSGSTTVQNPPGYLQNDVRELSLADGEYVASVTFTSTRYTCRDYYSNNVDSGYTSVSSMAMTTSAKPSRTVSLGGNAENARTSNPVTTTTFTAPNGWRIVGFRGFSTSYTDYELGNTAYPIVGLGAILAPVRA